MMSFRTGPRRLIAAFLVVLGLAGVPAGWAGYLWLSGNVHEVEAGSFYRSAQLSPEGLASVLDRYGIRTVINLRGPSSARWYAEERAVSTDKGIAHVDIALSANREPDPATIQELTRLLRDSPRPILVHCKGGADRSGLASALFLLTAEHRPAEEAGGQLSMVYGHFPWLFSRTSAMDRTFAKVASQLARSTGAD